MKEQISANKLFSKAEPTYGIEHAYFNNNLCLISADGLFILYTPKYKNHWPILINPTFEVKK